MFKHRWNPFCIYSFSHYLNHSSVIGVVLNVRAAHRSEEACLPLSVDVHFLLHLVQMSSNTRLLEKNALARIHFYLDFI